MVRTEAYNLLKEVFDNLELHIPGIRFDTYRDGGSVTFDVPTDGYRNILLVAPITTIYNQEHTSVTEWRIDTVKILKPGCIWFSDHKIQDKVMHEISLDDRIDGFDKDVIKKEIIKAITSKKHV